MIPDGLVQKIKEAAIIEDVISDFVSLKKRGKNYKGLCPFHNEKTPSFVVSSPKGIFKCFGCGAGGDAVSFVMQHESMTYPEALRYLAKKYNIEITETSNPKEREKQSKLTALKALNKFAANLYSYKFEGTPGYAYMHNTRKFTPETLNTFGIGYAPDKWDHLTKLTAKRGYQSSQLLYLGLAGQRKSDKGLYDRIRNRVVFPYYDLVGNIVGFNSRALQNDTKQAKYINSPNSALFNKSKILYGIYQAKHSIVKADCAYLVEGNTDVMSFYQKGITNTLGTSGTALTEHQVNLIKRFTSNVVLIFDADAAGMKAALSGINKLIAADIKVEILKLPQGNDPDSFAQSHTADQVIKYISENTKDFFFYQVEQIIGNTENPKEINEGIKEISKTLALLSDKQERNIYVNHLVKKYNLDRKLLEADINEQLPKQSADDSKELFALKYAQEAIKDTKVAIIEQDADTVTDAHMLGRCNTLGYVSGNTLMPLKNLCRHIIFNSNNSTSYPFFEDKEETELTRELKTLTSLGITIEIRQPMSEKK